MTDALRLDRVAIRLGRRTLIDLDAIIPPGEVLTVAGPSGSGKSTLLDFVAGFLDPAFTATGRVFCGPDELTALPPEDRRVGLMFQDAMLFPHMSVAENLAFALPRGVTDRQARVRDGLAEVGLEDCAGRDPATLSGGQRARVALMRTLLAEPRALLLDEPFSKLDAALRGQVRELVFGEARARGLPTLLVTHDPEDARAAGGQVFEIVPADAP